MTKGFSLEHDFRLLINNPRYSDIEIICNNEITLHGCRAILAARSDVFDALLYNEMKEKQISFPKFDSSGMEVILEYIYTGVIKEESLTKDNIVEAFNAAQYFQLLDLQDFIVKTVKITLEKNHNDNYSPELLSKIVDDTMSLTNDNILFNLLVEAVSIIPLYNIEFGRLSMAALQILLSCTYESEKPFATLEYEVFRYSTISVARQISDDATKILLKRLPNLENVDNSEPIDNEIIPDHQKIAKGLESLIKFIDFKRIKGQILVNIIEPLNVIPPETILNVYRHNTLSSNTVLNEGRGFLSALTFNTLNCVWDESACGSKLLMNNGNVVRAQNGFLHQNVTAKIALENKGVYEWDVIIEKNCTLAWVGVCASENLNYEIFAGYQKTAWVLGSSGDTDNSGHVTYYCPSFKEDNCKVTVHLDMNERNCAFTVNGTRYPAVSEWKNLPSKLYPIVSLKYPGQFRIQPHHKFDL
ncbi:11185_t:CDS:1 [Funneliformis geosporum]|nr:11185_t:CDS:1 [Funneliformis geosporum]